jgi:hypothetical protein
MWTKTMVLAVALGLAGCNALGLACEEMGCQGTLTVLLDRLPTEDAALSVDLGDGPLACGVAGATTEPLCAIEDGDEGPVLSVWVGMGQAPEVVTVSVSEGGAPAVDHELSVAWGEPWYPNGKACDGKDGGCRSGEAELALD